MKVLFLFGPNLGALGRRDPVTYGAETLEQIMRGVEERASTLGHEVTWRQSDHEGDLVGWLLAAGDEAADRVVINPGMSCGTCEACTAGEEPFCRQFSLLGEHRPDRDCVVGGPR